MSHRFTYKPSNSLIYLILSGVVCLIIPTPISAVYLISVGGEAPDPHFYYHSKLRQCVRYWGTGTKGAAFFSGYTLTLSLAYLGCLVACLVVVKVRQYNVTLRFLIQFPFVKFADVLTVQPPFRSTSVRARRSSTAAPFKTARR